MLYIPGVSFRESQRGQGLVEYVIIFTLAVGVLFVLGSLALSVLQSVGIDVLREGWGIFLSIS